MLPAPPPASLLPRVSAMLTAQYVHKDPRTGLHSIYNVYDGFEFPDFPAPQNIAMFAHITNVRRPTPVTMRVRDTEDAYPLLHNVTQVFSAPDPIHVLCLVFNGAIIVPAPGTYRVQLLVGEDVLAERLITAKIGGVPIRS